MTTLKDGWGLATDGKLLIITDSSPELYWVDPTTWKIVRQLTITDGGTPVPWVNEVGILMPYQNVIMSAVEFRGSCRQTCCIDAFFLLIPLKSF